MIPFEFVYLKPDTLEEAVQAYREFAQMGKVPLYYSGGSEIITMSRAGTIRPDAVIDIKGIPECGVLSQGKDWLTLGAALTLNQIKESKLFAPLTQACGRIADHTNQCRITLGGNLCGTIRYREASLPLLLCDAQAVLYDPEGMKTLPFDTAFQGQMHLKPGEMVVQVRVPVWALTARCAHIKKTTNEKIDYPLVNVTALVKDQALRVAFSGLTASPLRSLEVEAILNDRRMSPDVRAANAAEVLRQAAHGDVEGSKEYRLFVAQNTLKKLAEDFENDAL